MKFSYVNFIVKTLFYKILMENFPISKRKIFQTR
jgi:hypothetical protein